MKPCSFLSDVGEHQFRWGLNHLMMRYFDENDTACRKCHITPMQGLSLLTERQYANESSEDKKATFLSLAEQDKTTRKRLGGTVA